MTQLKPPATAWAISKGPPTAEPRAFQAFRMAEPTVALMVEPMAEPTVARTAGRTAARTAALMVEPTVALMVEPMAARTAARTAVPGQSWACPTGVQTVARTTEARSSR